MGAKNWLLPELSVFFPAYNEEKNIGSTVRKAISVLEKITPRWEVIVVDDGSQDQTGAVVKKIASKYPRGKIRLIVHHPNRGYGAALKSGFYNARYQWIAFTDADGQFDFRDIRNLIAKQKKTKADLVIGYYLGRKVPFYRVWGSRVWELAVWLLFGLKVKDIDCGFKLIRKKVIATIPHLEAERGPFISSEFLIKAKRAGFRIVQVGVHHFPRREGAATGSSPKVVLAGLRDLLVFWWKLHFRKDR